MPDAEYEFEMTTTISDHDIRERVIQGFKTTMMVEAGAGTGKTSLLLDRLLELIRNPEAQTSIDRIVAITFTEKAAGELKIRLREALERELSSADSGDPQQRLRQSLEDLERAPISTIHAFAARMLAERPVEAGVSPGFQTADALLQSVVLDEAWDAWLEREFQHSQPAVAEAIRAGASLERLRELAEALYRHRGTAVQWPEPVVVNLQTVASDVAQEIQELSSLVEVHCDDHSHSGYQRLQRMVERTSAWNGRTDAELARLLFRDALRKPVGAWSTSTSMKEMKARWLALFDRVEDALKRWRHNAAIEALRWLQGFQDEIEARKQAADVLDFDDLLLKTRDLLRDNRALRRYFQQRYDYLLVDEFQDTDPLQAEIVCLLAEDGADAADWESVQMKPGKLLLVGDPKQSIYRFRRADIEIYERVKAVVQRQGLVLQVTQNYRSTPSLLDWVNTVFQAMIQPPDEGHYQPAYEAIQPYPERVDPPHGVSVRYLHIDQLVETDDDGIDAVRREEARSVAAYVRLALDEGWPVWDRHQQVLRPLALRDCCLLFRTRSSVDLYEEALREAGLDYRLEGGKRFFSQQETVALLNVLMAIDQPTHHMAVVAALRSAFFGISDNVLTEWVLTCGPPQYLQAVSGDRWPTLTTALGVLRDLHLRRNRCSTAALIHELFARTAALELFYLKPEGEQRVANLSKVLDLARAQERVGRGSLKAFVRWYQKMESHEIEESESPAVEDTDNVIRLMTIHKAKGLEFPLVVLVNLFGTTQDRDMIVTDPLSHTVACRFASGPLPFETLNMAEARTHEAARVAAEEQRVLYVAGTRARDYLVMTGFGVHVTRQGARSLWRHLAPYLTEADEVSTAPLHRVSTTDLELSERSLRAFRLAWDPDNATNVMAAQVTEAASAWRTALEHTQALGRRYRPALTATSLKAASGSKPGAQFDAEWERTGADGRQVGVVVHHVLEYLPFTSQGNSKTDTSALVHACVEGELIRSGSSLKLGTEVERLVTAALASTWIHRAGSAARCYREMPWVVNVPDGVVEGQMDVVFVDDDGWCVLDFKTDEVSTIDEARERVHSSYREQAGLYAWALSEHWGLRVQSVVFLFLRLGESIEVDVDEELLAPVRERIVNDLV